MINKVKALVSGQKKDPVLKQLEAIDSPVIEKLHSFSVNKVNLLEEIKKNRTRIKELKEQLEIKETEYMSNGYNPKTLQVMMKIKAEITDLEMSTNQQQLIAFREQKNSYYNLTDEDKQSLIKGFAPVRAKQDELYQEFLDKYAALEETLRQLHLERDHVEEVFITLFQHIQTTAGEKGGRWAENHLGNFPYVDINRQLKSLHIDHGFDYNKAW